MFLRKQTNLRKLTVRLPQGNQEIFVGAGLDQFMIDKISNKKYSKIVGLIDKNLPEIYPRLFKFLQNKLEIDRWIYIEPEEKSKSLVALNSLMNKCIEFKPDRKSCFLAIGGGIVGDIAGFLASIYMRGIEMVFIPTTLMAQSDTIINKVGISYKVLKNIIGNFYSPSLTICDVSFLKTLPKKEIILGFSEIIKHALIDSNSFVLYLDKNLRGDLEDVNESVWEEIVYRSLKVKSKLVSRDPLDTKGDHKGLSYGHTFANAIEGIFGFRFRHGEAVSIGMHLAGLVSNKLHFLGDDDLKTQKRLLLNSGLPIGIPEKVNKSLFIQMLRSDKIAVDGEVLLVLLEKIGKFRVYKISDKKIISWALDSVMPRR